MFKRRTLFVVGAGASAEVRFDIGWQLAQKIADNMKPRKDQRDHASITDEFLLDEFRRRKGYDKPYSDFMAAARRIHEGIELTNSVDDFLNVHQENPLMMEVGKAAIIRAILAAEASCDMRVDQSNTYNRMDIRSIGVTWFVKLMRVLAPSTKPQSPSEAFHNVSFVVFNYDRCLEHFLEYAVAALYGIERMKAREVVKQIRIIHPYGHIGDLDVLPFGGEKGKEYPALSIADRIKTYAEQLTDEDELAAIHNEVVNSECIVFLGFSYLEQNMALLRPMGKIQWKPIFGTAFGLSDNDTRVVRDQIYSMFQDEGSLEFVELNNKIRCAGLFDFYARSLNAGIRVM